MPRSKGKYKGEIENVIQNVLVDAPTLRGYTIKDLSDKINRPWPTTRWHLELMEARGEVTYQEIGRAKLYFLPPNTTKKKRES